MSKHLQIVGPSLSVLLVRLEKYLTLLFACCALVERENKCEPRVTCLQVLGNDGPRHLYTFAFPILRKGRDVVLEDVWKLLFLRRVAVQLDYGVLVWVC